MSLLQAKNLHHSYGDHALLDGVNLTLEAGERVCLVGRNGSGKSTLLKIIAGRIKVDEGDIITSAGISAGIDMSLHIVSKLHSLDLATL